MIELIHRKKVSTKFSKASTKICLSLHLNGDESYLYVNKKEIYKSKERIVKVGIFSV